MAGSEPTGSGTGRAKRNPILERYRLVVPWWYSAWLHALGLVAAAAGGLWLVWWRAGDVAIRPWVWATVPLAVFFAAGLEYVAHRFPMHKRHKGLLERLFVRHSMFHHRFFTHEAMSVENSKQMYLVFFEIELGFLVAIVMLLTHIVLRNLGSADVAAVTCSTLILYWLALELVHAMAHLPEAAFRRLPFRLAPFRYLREFHRIHHDPKLMRKHNFGVTLPLFDWIFGTSAGAVHPSEREPDPAPAPSESYVGA